MDELAHCVALAMGVEPNIAYLPPRNEVMAAYSSHEKIRRIFGERKLYTLEEGLSRMAGWAKLNGARISQKFKDIEVTKNFPVAWLS